VSCGTTGGGATGVSVGGIGVAGARVRELEEALRQRDMRGALAIAANLDNMFQVVEKSAELIVIRLESAQADPEESSQ
jgi:dihydrodipicolinate synthase/N-acetylneuraminate lyase